MSPDGLTRVPPEEKLLRLIRGKGQTKGPAPSTPVGVPTGGGSRQGWRLPSQWFMVLNIVLGCVVVGELLMWWRVTTQAPPIVTAPASTRASPLASQPTPAATESPTHSANPPADAATSLASAATRPMFHVETSSQAASASTPTAQAPSDQIKALSARLSLLGIVAGDPPQAIIEDAQTKKTYFVKTGQPVVEGLVVKEVREERVVLELSGETLELSL